jgi:putative ABC transport system substrate-binding protein
MRRREFIALIGGLGLSRPLGSRAQQPRKINRMAIVHPTIPKIEDLALNPNWVIFVSELERLGHVEGANLIIDRYSGEGVLERLPDLAREVVRQAPDVIVAPSIVMAKPIKEATNTIPVVTITSDPVSLGFAISLAHPGGNITGAVIDVGLQVWEKRFELLREVVPAPATVAFPISSEYVDHPYGHAFQQAAKKAGFLLTFLELQSPVAEPEFRRAFAALRQKRPDAVVIGDGPSGFVHRHLIVNLIEEIRLPAVYPFREYMDVGGLMAYAVELRSLYAHMAKQVDQILKGAKPGNIPFYQATKFEVLINLKAAKALGLTIPPSLLARADEVIE